MHMMSMMRDCTVSTVLVVHIFDFLASLFSVKHHQIAQSEANFAVILHI